MDGMATQYGTAPQHGTAPQQGVGLGATVRAWRERLSPSSVGLPSGRARRTTGLRREELAERAGLSVDYVVRLEQGRATRPSAQVVASLADALRLTRPERDHLHRMAGLVPVNDEPVPDRVPPGVHRLLNRLGDAAVAVFAADWRLIHWNPAWAALLGDPAATPPELRNFARERFPVGPGRGRVAHWPVLEENRDRCDLSIVSDLRRASGRFPHDTRLNELIRVLATGNRTFARLWASGTVAAHRQDRKTVEHPTVGRVEVDCDVLTDGDCELKIVILTASPGSTDEDRLRLAMSADSGSRPTPSP
ncbi:helix-turn-helix transcriptional regulator [Streptomyces sp. NPDC088766]|uniref:helix-turn-helix transcriptional regulator n=1 Tax=Streptomyces sp. NPDC088766 TaxID=3365893 RepID=UPI0037F2DFCB